jgi:hypothetical protein
MIITKKTLSRRTMLRGVGTAVALPLLDAMFPAMAAAPGPVRRLGVVYHPNGVIYDQWLPKGVGVNYELSPTLAVLKPFRDKLIVVTGLASDEAEALGDGGGDHSRASGTYLTGVHVRKSDSVRTLHPALFAATDGGRQQHGGILRYRVQLRVQ